MKENDKDQSDEGTVCQRRQSDSKDDKKSDDKYPIPNMDERAFRGAIKALVEKYNFKKRIR